MLWNWGEVCGVLVFFEDLYVGNSCLEWWGGGVGVFFLVVIGEVIMVLCLIFICEFVYNFNESY